MSPPIRFWFLPRREKVLFFEAITLLTLSHLSVKLISFNHIYRFLNSGWNEELPGGSGRAEDIRLINLSLLRAAGRLPFRCLCLSRSIATFIMLRRRDVPAVILAGVKFEGLSLAAHAWVRAGSGANDQEPENMAFAPILSIGQETDDD
jgi:hypothetical protein